MLFSKNTGKKRSHPGVVLTIGALAVVGAISAVNTGKRWIKDKTGRLMCFIKGRHGSCDDTCEYD